MNLINLIVAERSELFRKGLVSLLERSSQIGRLDEAHDECSLMKHIKSSEIEHDLVLIDYEFTEWDRFNLIKKIRKVNPDIKVLALSSCKSPGFILPLLQAGINGLLPKNDSPDELLNAIVSTVRKGHYYSSEVSELIHQALLSSKETGSKNNFEILKAREIEIIRLVCMEFTAAEIGCKLRLSVRTVEGYKKKLLHKTHCKNSAGLVVFAIANNIVDIHELVKQKEAYLN